MHHLRLIPRATPIPESRNFTDPIISISLIVAACKFAILSLYTGLTGHKKLSACFAICAIASASVGTIDLFLGRTDPDEAPSPRRRLF